MAACEAQILEQSDILHTALEQTIEELHYTISSILDETEVRELSLALNAAVESAYSEIGRRSAGFVESIGDMRNSWLELADGRTESLEQDISRQRVACEQATTEEMQTLSAYVDTKLGSHERWAGQEAELFNDSVSETLRDWGAILDSYCITPVLD